MMKLFRENSLQLLAVNYFDKKALTTTFNRVVTMPLPTRSKMFVNARYQCDEYAQSQQPHQRDTSGLTNVFSVHLKHIQLKPTGKQT